MAGWQPMYVDNYCERTAAGLWAEPANAATNLAFIVASLWLLLLLYGRRRAGRAPLSVWLLPIALGVVGICSLAFHTFATSVTGALDSLSIILFILIAVVVLVHWMWRVPWRWAWLAAPAYLFAAVAINVVAFAIGGERATLAGYLPALVGLVVFGVAIRLTAPAASTRFGGWLLGAAAVFAVSLAARTLDETLCQDFPLGTHFVWHCLNALVLFLVALTVIRVADQR